MPTNRLINEKSPYLLQHAHNPVDWHAWNQEAFDKARSEDKPIFLSIGYSTCHWCHVMERESFESEEIAGVLNSHFIPIKIDREERPDVDRIYMAFVQASTGSGGWPMSVWLTPELKPFFGGTYFPPDNRYGRPGFLYLLQQLANSWATERSRIVESSESVISQLALQGLGTESGELDPAWLDSAFFAFRRAFDTRHGGFGPAPKFPRPSALNFLFRYGVYAKNEEASEMALTTLRAMAHGGMHDHLGGGFHRYSVDGRWFVPHFEKMLYDQAQLAISYLEAFQISGDAFFADIARGIFEYVQRDMTHPDGGFYSAEDADSVIDPADPHTKGEGAFYVWTKDELDELLGRSSEAFCRHYGVEAAGNVHEDPHHEFEGKNILFELDSPSGPFGAEKAVLLAERNKRIRPHLDDKILTAWNGLMISAFAKGAGVLNEPRYLNAAQRAYDFIHETLHESDRLLRRFRDGEAAIPGFLDDYAFLTQAALDLYAAGLDPVRLAEAVRLADATLELFEDPEHGGFFATAAGDESLVMRLKEDYDGAEPSGNSITVSNLLRLAHITGNERYRQSGVRTLKLFAARLKSASSGVPQMMASFLLSLTPPRQVVIAGENPDELLRVYRSRFLPNHTLLAVNEENRAEISSVAQAVANMTEVDGQAAAYVCENFTCQLPTTSRERLAELLD